MTIENLQFRIHEDVLKVIKERFPRCSDPQVMYERGWFEHNYFLDLNVFGHNIRITIYVHVDVFDHGTKDENGNPKYFITWMMGFRSPYDEKAWQDNKWTETILFDLKEDTGLHCIDFVYKPHPKQSFVMTIRQFAADLELNLRGRYLVYLADINGIG